MFIFDMIESSTLLRTISTTATHVEMDGLDSSNGLHPYTNPDLALVDTSVYPTRRDLGYRSDTHLDVSFGDISTMFSKDPYADLWYNINIATQKFYNTSTN